MTAKANGRIGSPTTHDDQESTLGAMEELGLRRDLLTSAMLPLRPRARHPRRAPLREDPTTLEDLAQKYGVSRERVRQIEVRAFEKLQKLMQTSAAERKLLPSI